MQCTENFQCIHYDVDQEYKAHLDAYVCAQLLRLTLTLLLGLICARAVWRSYDLNTPRGQRTTAKGGQRLITVLIYLSDVEEVSEPTSQSCSQPAPHAVVILDDTPLSICPSVRLPPSVSAWGNANGAAGGG
jgi:hypothetical protein